MGCGDAACWAGLVIAEWPAGVDVGMVAVEAVFAVGASAFDEFSGHGVVLRKWCGGVDDNWLVGVCQVFSVGEFFY